MGVLTGGRLSVEDAYAYAKFARVALRTNDIDFRARPHSNEETEFLTSVVAGTGLGVTYRGIEGAPAVLLAGFEPEEESPIVFLRLRKAARRRGLRLFSAAPFATPAGTKALGTLLPTAPGGEAALLDALAGDTADSGSPVAAAAAALRQPGAVILVGERLARSPGALSAAVRLAAATSSGLAWVPRRAGERGALDAGAFPTLLPGGRPVADPGVRADLSGAWGVQVPSAPGRDTDAILQAALRGELDALVVAGVDPADLPDPALAREAMAHVPLLVSLELRRSPVTELADIVLPVASVMEKAGTFYDWEGRPRLFEQALDTPALPDLRVLDLIAGEMGAGHRAARRCGCPPRARGAGPVPRGAAARARGDAAAAAGARTGRGGAGDLGLAAGRGPDAGWRAAPGRDGAQALPAPVAGHGRRGGRSRG